MRITKPLAEVGAVLALAGSYPAAVEAATTIKASNSHHAGELVIKYSNLIPPFKCPAEAGGACEPGETVSSDAIAKVNKNSVVSNSYTWLGEQKVIEWDTWSKVICLGGNAVHFEAGFYRGPGTAGSVDLDQYNANVHGHSSSTCEEGRLTNSYIDHVEHNFTYPYDPPVGIHLKAQ